MYILLFLAIAVLSRFLPSPAYLKAAILLEIPLSLWLCHQYGFMMVFLSISSLCVYLPLFERPGRLWLAFGHLALLNIAITDYDALLHTTANLLFLFLAVTFHRIHEMNQKELDHIHLYDELKRLHFQQDEAGRQLLQFAHQVESAAQAEERNRISRQLHDDIGHRLIRVKMMMEAALHIVPQDAARGMDMLHQIRDQLGESMEQMRTAVKQMNPSRRITDDYSLDRLLEETGRRPESRPSLCCRGFLIRFIQANRWYYIKMPAKPSPTPYATARPSRSKFLSSTETRKFEWRSPTMARSKRRRNRSLRQTVMASG